LIAVVQQVRGLVPVVYGASGVTLFLFYLAADVTGRSFFEFIRDPTVVGRRDYLTGSLSNLGVLLWWSGGVAAVLAAWTRRRDRRAIPLLAAGLFTGWLALDDLFMLHETFFPPRGLSEQAVTRTYAAVALAYVWIFRDFLRRSEWTLAATAAGLLASSAIMDGLGGLAYWEESLKFLGIAGWTAFLVRTAVSTLAGRPLLSA
jgi:hypothetical protein